MDALDVMMGKEVEPPKKGLVAELKSRGLTKGLTGYTTPEMSKRVAAYGANMGKYKTEAIHYLLAEFFGVEA